MEDNDSRLERLARRYGSSAPKDSPRGHGMRGRRGFKGGKPKDMSKTVKRILSYISRDKYKLFAAFFFVLLSSGASLAGSYMLRPIINRFIAPTNGSPSLTGLAGGLAAMALVYAVGVVSSYMQSKIMINISQNAICKIRGDLFSKLQTLPVKFFDTNSNGELMSRCTNDVDTIGEMLNNTVVQLFSAVITIVGTLSLMVYTNIYLTLVTLVMFPLFINAGKAVAKRSQRYFSQQQSALGAVNGCIEEIVSGQKVVKVFCHEDEAVSDFKLLNDDLRRKQTAAQFTGGVMGPLMGNLSQINYALTACVGGLLCIAKGFDVGGLTVFVNFSRQFSRPINEISMQVSSVFSALAGAERVFAIMDEEPETDLEGKICAKNIVGEVTFKDVTFGYGSDAIIKNINLTAEPGQKIAFVGSTGAGKTTVTNLLSRFYDTQEGTITIDGVNIRDIRRDELRRNIAMVLQDTHLFTGTVMENIRYGRPDASDEDVIAAAKTASAHSFILRLEKGYQTVLEGDGANLSQGQRQLLNIARAALSKAPILVLDEATSSVDTRTERHIEHGMDRLMKNRTTLVIAHRLSTIRNADQICVMHEGKIVERGTHDELIAMNRYYKKLVDMQKF